MLARCFWFALLLFALLMNSAAVAQEQSPGDPKATEQAFEEKFAEWKSLMKQINSLRIEYQAAEESRRAGLLVELNATFEAAASLEPDVVDAAVAAYQTAPNQNKEITGFLLEVAKYYFSVDRYDRLLPVAEVLVAGKVDQPQIAVWGGIAAVAVGDFDKAEKLFAVAMPTLQTAGQADQQYVQMASVLAANLDQFKQQWEQEQAIRAAEAAADDLPRVQLKTNKGEIVIELFENEAPNTVKSFLSLVEDGFYDGLTFHRVLPNFMAQGGCPEGTGTGGPGYTIPCECDAENARLHFRGSLSMAHAGKDTGGSQFFLTFLPTPHLDQGHTVFGRVIEGFDVLSKLQRRDPQNPKAEADKILDAEVIRKRPNTDYSVFDKS